MMVVYYKPGCVLQEVILIEQRRPSSYDRDASNMLCTYKKKKMENFRKIKLIGKITSYVT